MSKQPEALRLADEISGEWLFSTTLKQAAAELRRLHDVEKKYHESVGGFKRDLVEKLEQQRNKNKLLREEIKCEERRFSDLWEQFAALDKVNQELVKALEMMTDRFLDTEGKYGSYEQEAMDLADSALAKARGTE